MISQQYEHNNEYSQKEAFRIHSCDDHNKICHCGGVVAALITPVISPIIAPLDRHSTVLGICMTTGLFVIGYTIEHNEWSERYIIYKHII